MRVSLATLLVSLTVVASAQYPPDVKCIVSNGQGYAFGNPRQIAIGAASDLKPSPDGKFVAFSRVVPMDPLDEVRGKPVTMKMVFSIWNAQADQVWNAVDVTAANPTMIEFGWSPGYANGVLVLQRSLQVDKVDKIEVVVDRVAASAKQRTTIARYVLDQGSNADLSPDGHYVLVRDLDNKSRDEVLDVTTGQRTNVPHDKPGDFRLWGANSKLLVFRRSTPTGPSSTFFFDFDSRKLIEAGPGERMGVGEPDPFIVSSVDMGNRTAATKVLVAQSMYGPAPLASTTPAAVAGAPRQTAKPAETAADKLVQSDPSLRGPVVLDADPGSWTISKEGRYVAYAKRGGAYILPFEPVDIDWLNKMMATKAKLQAMNKAKQIGVALMIYSADYDDMLPLNTDWQNSVDPYLKNRDMLNGFNYILNGNDLTKLDNPQNTMLGSFDTPYGRAVVYADGHVKWEPGSSIQAVVIPVVGDDKKIVVR